MVLPRPFGKVRTLKSADNVICCWSLFSVGCMLLTNATQLADAFVVGTLMDLMSICDLFGFSSVVPFMYLQNVCFFCAVLLGVKDLAWGMELVDLQP